jgi:hypothetical protein
MVETADQLATATLNGCLLSFGHGVLIHALRGWHIALYEVPARTREVVCAGGHLVVETMAGQRFTGDVLTEYTTKSGEYVLLTVVGSLTLESSGRVA